MRTPPESALPDNVVDQAITWLVRLQSGEVSPQTRAACQRWREADPLHECAWQALHASDADFQVLASLPGSVARDTLERAQYVDQDRRHTLRLLGLGLVLCAAGAWSTRQLPLAGWSTDYATGVGERRSFNLSDGTRLKLNTASAVNVHFSRQRRLIELKRGDIYIDTGADAASAEGRRAFWVSSRHAQLEAIGTGFCVRDEGERTRLRVDQGVVAIHHARQTLQVAAGEEYLIGREQVQAVSASHMSASAWARGQLVATRMPLGELIDELARYRHGWLSCESAVAGLQVSGVFQLASIDGVLNALSDSVPVRIQRIAPFWVRVVAR